MLRDSFLINVNKIHCFIYNDSKRTYTQIQKVVIFPYKYNFKEKIMNIYSPVQRKQAGFQWWHSKIREPLDAVNLDFLSY